MNTLSSPPLSVEAALAAIKKLGIWHVVSRNSHATSCKDAASRRQRLGKIGIPLSNELRSLVVAYEGDNAKQLVMLHCRANLNFDELLVKQVLGIKGEIEYISKEELAQHIDMQYGTVNPFLVLDKNIQHVFDQSLKFESLPPHTMMTNLGDFEWGIEFSPIELVDVFLNNLDKTLVDNITTQDYSLQKNLVKIGILTGNGPESGMSLWKSINSYVSEFLNETNYIQGDLGYPHIHIQSLPEMGLSMELIERKEQVWSVIKNAILNFCKSEVTHIAIACNTTTLFAPQIREVCEPYGVKFISMAEVLETYIKSYPDEDWTLLAIPSVASMGEYSSYKDLKKLNVLPLDESVQQAIHELGYLIKQTIRDSQAERSINKLRDILKLGVNSKNVIIALTEISILLEKAPKIRKKGHLADIRIVDTLDLYAKNLAKLYVDSIP